MKTIIARFTELKSNVAGTEDSEFEDLDYNKVDTALKSVGVSIKDASGQFRDLDDVFLELSAKWNTLDRNTQRYIATIAAGSRQQSRFIAMMDNYERTIELVDTAYDSSGKSSEQFAKYQDTLEYKLNKLQNTWEQFRTRFFNSEFFKKAIDGFNQLLGRLDDLNGFNIASLATGLLVLGKTVIPQIIGSFQNMSNQFIMLGGTVGGKIINGIQTVFNKIPPIANIKAELDKKSEEQLKKKIKEITKKYEYKNVQIKNQVQGAELGPKTSEQQALRNAGGIKSYVNTLKLGGTALEEFENKLKQQINALRAQNNQTELNENELNEYILKLREQAQALQANDDEMTNEINQLRQQAQAATDSIEDSMLQGGQAIGGALVTGITMMFSGASFDESMKAMGTQLIATALPMVVTPWLTQVLVPMVTGTTAAAETIKATLISTGVGAIIVAIGVLLAVGIPAISKLIKKNKEQDKIASDSYYRQEKQLEKLTKAQEELNQELDEANKKHDEAKENYDSMQDAYATYEELTSKIIRTEEEEQALIDAQNTLAEQNKDLVTKFDEEGNAILSVSDAYKLATESASEFAEVQLEQQQAELAANFGNVQVTETELSMAQETAKLADNQTLQSILDMDYWNQAGEEDAFNALKSFNKQNRAAEKAFIDAYNDTMGTSYTKDQVQEVYDAIGEAGYDPEENKVWREVRDQYIENLDEMTEAVTEAEDKLAEEEEKLSQSLLSVIEGTVENKNLDGLNENINNIYQDLATGYAEGQHDDWLIEYDQVATAQKGTTEYAEGYAEYISNKLNTDETLKQLEEDFATLTEKEQALVMEYFERSGEMTLEEQENYIKELQDKGLIDIASWISEDVADENELREQHLEVLKDIVGEDSEIIDYYNNLGLDAALGFYSSFANISAEEQTGYIQSINNFLENARSQLGSVELSEYFGDLTEEDIFSKLLSYDLTQATGAQLTAYKKEFIETVAGSSEEGAKLAAEIFQEYYNNIYSYTDNAILRSEDQVKEYFKKFREEINVTAEEIKKIRDAFNEIVTEGSLTSDTIFSLIESGQADKLMAGANGSVVFDVNAAYEEQYQAYAEQLSGAISDRETAKLRLSQLQEGTAEYEEQLKAVNEAENQIKGIMYGTYATEKEAAEELAKIKKDAYNEYLKAELDYQDAIKERNKLEKELHEAQYGTDYYESSLDSLYNYNIYLEDTEKLIEKLKEEILETQNIEMGKESLDKMTEAYRNQALYANAQKNVLMKDMEEIKTIMEDEFANVFSFNEFGKIQLEEGLLESMPNALKEQAEAFVERYNEDADKVYEIDEGNIQREEAILEYFATLRDNYISMQQEIADVLKENAEEEVNTIKDKYDAIKEADDDYLSALESAIEKQRQLREKENQYETLAQKEKKLALMQRDTSGANQKEVQNLEREVTEERENVLESEIDRTIESLRELYETQQEARDKEIEYLNTVIESTQYWQAANDLIASFSGPEDYSAWMLENSSETENMSVEQIAALQEELKTAYESGITYLSGNSEQFLSMLNFTSDEVEAVEKETFTTILGYSEATLEKVKEESDENIEELKKDLAEANTNIEDTYDTWIQKDTAYQNSLKLTEQEMSNFLTTFTSAVTGASDLVYTEYIDLIKEMAGVGTVEDLVKQGVLTQEQYDKYVEYSKDQIGSQGYKVTYGSGANTRTVTVSNLNDMYDNIYIGNTSYGISQVKDVATGTEITGGYTPRSLYGTSSTSASDSKNAVTGNIIDSSKYGTYGDENYIKRAYIDGILNGLESYSTQNDAAIAAKNQGARFFYVVQKNDGSYVPITDLNTLKMYDEFYRDQSMYGISSLEGEGRHGNVWTYRHTSNDGAHRNYQVDKSVINPERTDIFEEYFKYAKGGLVNYTGPAWVDGTPQKPEAFLNSEDTARIGEAAKLLADLPIFNKTSNAQNAVATNIGDTSIEIHINVESISDDYDVDQMIERVKQDIVDVAKPIGTSVILNK